MLDMLLAPFTAVAELVDAGGPVVEWILISCIVMWTLVIERVRDMGGERTIGQLIETLPPAVDDAAMRRHYELVAGTKTGTLFRLEEDDSWFHGIEGMPNATLQIGDGDHLAVAGKRAFSELLAQDLVKLGVLTRGAP